MYDAVAGADIGIIDVFGAEIGQTLFPVCLWFRDDAGLRAWNVPGCMELCMIGSLCRSSTMNGRLFH